MTPVLLLSMLMPAQAQDFYAPGEAVDDGISIHLTEKGLSGLGAVAGAVVPGNIPIDDIADGATNTDFLGCVDDYFYGISNLWIGMEIVDLTIVPDTDVLNLDTTIDVWVNTNADPFLVELDFLCGETDCVGSVERFPVNIQAPITLAVTDPLEPDRPIDVTIGTLLIDIPDDLGAYIDMQSGCLSEVEDVMDALGFSFYGLITSLVVPFVEDFAQDLGPELEGQLEEALVATNFEDTFDVLGTELYVHLYPNDVITTPEGLEIVMSSEMLADRGQCMMDSDSPGSLKTGSPRPSLAAQPADTELALHLSDDMINQALWSIWDSGIMCFTLPDPSGESAFDVPIPLNTSLLGLLAGDAFNELFPDTQDLIIQTDPREPMLIDYQSAHDVEIDARALDINFYADLDYRKARALGLTLEADVGVDVNFNGATGDMAIDIDLTSDDALRVSAENNELVPEASADIEENFSGLLGTIIDSVAGDSLSGLSFQLPSADGVGLKTLSFQTTGPSQDWLSGYATLGEVPYGAGSGCDCGSGSDSGCDSGGTGCVTLGPLPVSMVAFLVPLILLRRRQD